MRELLSRIGLIVISHILWSGVHAQQPEVFLSVESTALCGAICTDDVVGEVDLSDYIIYEIYLYLPSPSSCVSSVFGADTDLFGPDCISDVNDMILEIPCGAFQHPMGTTFLSDNVCDLYEIFPCLQYDSFLTIGDHCELQEYTSSSLINGCDLESISLFNGDGVNPYSGQGFILDTGQMFAPGGVAPDSEGRVLLARVVSCGDLYFQTSLFFMNECGSGSGQFVFSPDLSIFQPQPCLANPMGYHSNPECENQGTITFYQGGNGFVDYSLFSSNGQFISQFDNVSGDLIISDLMPGEYYLSMTDSIGCCSQSEVFVIPPEEDLLLPPQISVQIVSDVTCSDSANGVVLIDSESGNGEWQVTYEHNGVELSVGNYGMVGELTCGDYLFSAVDSAGCIAETTVMLECPEDVIVETVAHQLPCFGDSVGVIEFYYSGLQGDGTILIEGMTDQIVGEIAGEDGYYVVDSMSSGLYIFSITDSLGCVQSGSVELIDPDPLWCEAYSGNEEMGNDGWVCVDVSGGTGELTFVWSNGSEDFCADQIAAGVYSVVVTDENGCTCEQTIEVYAGIENDIKIHEDILIWPNPAYDILFVKSERQLSPVSIFISDAAGRILMREEDWEFAPIDISHLAEGCYRISLLSGEKRYSAMFAVIR